MSYVTQSQRKQLSRRWLKQVDRMFASVWAAFICALLLWGWFNRNEGYITAERGIGYWLGIIGGSLLIILLIYSVQKRRKKRRRFLSVKFWFRFHMILGVVGPVCILFHSNFGFGSVNSSVALICMLTVAGSGLIGRYFYTRIHYGLYGSKIQIKQILTDFRALKSDIMELVETKKQEAAANKVFNAIEAMIEEQRQPPKLSRVMASRRRAKDVAAACKQFLRHLERYHRDKGRSRKELAAIRRTINGDFAVILAVLRRLPGLHLFERLFSLWHVFHIPFFGLMLITGITHVVVVHMY